MSRVTTETRFIHKPCQKNKHKKTKNNFFNQNTKPVNDDMTRKINKTFL